MHHIHHTHAMILGSRSRGEANKVFVLLTRELGLIHATAQGVRLNKSKLRYALTDYGEAKIDLVHGREMWRITSATPVNSFSNIRHGVYGMRLLASVSKLLRRLLAGESEHHEVLFDDLKTTYDFLESRECDAHVYEVVELCLVLRILKHLGYLNSDTHSQYMTDTFDPAGIDYTRFEKKTILFEINRALRESHL